MKNIIGNLFYFKNLVHKYDECDVLWNGEIKIETVNCNELILDSAVRHLLSK